MISSFLNVLNLISRAFDFKSSDRIQAEIKAQFESLKVELSQFLDDLEIAENTESILSKLDELLQKAISAPVEPTDFSEKD